MRHDRRMRGPLIVKRRSVGPSTLPAPVKYRAGCSCGWTGELRDSQKTTEADYSRHLQRTGRMFGPRQ